MILVYHNKNFIDYNYKDDAPKSEELVLVAEVPTTEKEVAYRLTNNIEESWVDAAREHGITVHRNKVDAFHDPAEGHRSTSVGDVMFDGEKWWMVKGIGYKELEGFSLEDTRTGD